MQLIYIEANNNEIIVQVTQLAISIFFPGKVIIEVNIEKQCSPLLEIKRNKSQ